MSNALHESRTPLVTAAIAYVRQSNLWYMAENVLLDARKDLPILLEGKGNSAYFIHFYIHLFIVRCYDPTTVIFMDSVDERKNGTIGGYCLETLIEEKRLVSSSS